MPAEDAIPLDPAHAWVRSEHWQYTPHRLEAPLDARRAARFDVDGQIVLRVDERDGSHFVQGAQQQPRTPPSE